MKELNANEDGQPLAFNGLQFQILLFSAQIIQWGWQIFHVFASADVRVQGSFPMGIMTSRMTFQKDFYQQGTIFWPIFLVGKKRLGGRIFGTFACDSLERKLQYRKHF